MEKLKKVGADPVSAKKEIIDDCPEFSKRNKPKAHGMPNLHSNFRGITLIALIITIIVMLILVGVTITVALKGGLFETATKAATGTQKEAERERLTEIALANYNIAEGKITDANDLASKIQSSLGLKKSDKTTDSKLVVEGKNTLWQIDLNTAEVSECTSLKGKLYKYDGIDVYVCITSENKIMYIYLTNNSYGVSDNECIVEGNNIKEVIDTKYSNYTIEDERILQCKRFIKNNEEGYASYAISEDGATLYNLVYAGQMQNIQIAMILNFTEEVNLDEFLKDYTKLT